MDEIIIVGGCPLLFPTAKKIDAKTGLEVIDPDFVKSAYEKLISLTSEKPAVLAAADAAKREYPFTLKEGHIVLFTDGDELKSFNVRPKVWSAMQHFVSLGMGRDEHIQGLQAKVWDGDYDADVIRILSSVGNTAFKRANFPWRFRRKNGFYVLTAVETGEK